MPGDSVVRFGVCNKFLRNFSRGVGRTLMRVERVEVYDEVCVVPAAILSAIVEDVNPVDSTGFPCCVSAWKHDRRWFFCDRPRSEADINRIITGGSGATSEKEVVTEQLNPVRYISRDAPGVPKSVQPPGGSPEDCIL